MSITCPRDSTLSAGSVEGIHATVLIEFPPTAVRTKVVPSIKPMALSLLSTLDPLLEPIRPAINKCIGACEQTMSKLGDLTRGLLDREYGENSHCCPPFSRPIIQVLAVSFCLASVCGCWMGRPTFLAALPEHAVALTLSSVVHS